MPKIINPTSNDVCFLCKRQAFFKSFNVGNNRCLEKITQCPGFIAKAEKSRQEKISKTERKEHMKLMSKNGNAKLKLLHSDPAWRHTKGDNISNAKIENGSAIPKPLRSAWKLYEMAVDNITRESWIYHQDKINPQNLQRGSEIELDHKYSKSQGFKNNIPPEIIGHYSNLELIEKSINRKKYNKSSITIEELYSGVNSI